jgi:hypothetical protein
VLLKIVDVGCVQKVTCYLIHLLREWVCWRGRDCWRIPELGEGDYWRERDCWREGLLKRKRVYLQENSIVIIVKSAFSYFLCDT